MRWTALILLFLSGPQASPDLLRNGDAESGKIDGWEGNAKSVANKRNRQWPGPGAGKRYFQIEDSLQQTVRLPSRAAGQLAVLRARICASEAGIELLDSKGKRLAGQLSGVAPSGRWTESTVRVRIPRNARKVRVTITARRGFADEIKLVVEKPPAPPARVEILLGPVLSWPEPDRIRVWWHLNAEMDGHEVEYGMKKSLGNKAKIDSWTAYPYIEIDGLKPGTWHYRVKSPGVKSDVKSFTLVDPAKEFRIGFWADNQNGTDIFTNQTVPALLKEKPAFILVPGDLVQNGPRYDEWKQQLYGPAKDLLSTIPFLPARGNHDGETPLAYQMLPIPGTARWHAVTYGRVRIVALDTNLDFGPGSDQLEWLKTEVASNEWTSAKYRIIFFHHPPFTTLWCHPRYDGEPLGRSTLVPLLEKADTTMIVSGHAHCYEHGVRGKTHYFIVGGGGGKLDTTQVWKWPHVKKSESRHHIFTADVTKEGLLWRAIDSKTGEVFDEGTIPGS